MKKLAVFIALVGLLIVPALAHPGGTDYKGGHTDRSTGEYHYHHGYSAHDHVDGVCPYDFDDKTGEDSGSWGGGVAYASTTSYKSSDWYPEYTAAKAALRKAEATRFRDAALSGAGGFALGLALLIVQRVRSNRRLEESERRMREHETQALRKVKADVESEWAVKLRICEIEKGELEQKLIAERKGFEEDRLRYEAERRETSRIYLRKAKQAMLPEQKDAYLAVVVNNALPPTEEKGLVYVPSNMNGGLYHREHSPCGVSGMKLASRANVEAYGLRQCPRCAHAAQPTGDPVVYAAPSGSLVYHKVRASCAGYTAKETTLSDALKRGLRPCSKCHPPAEKPRVWF